MKITHVSMKSCLWVGAAVAALYAPASHAQVPEQAKHCLACHAVDQRVVGPSFKEVAQKYDGNKAALRKLAEKVRAGGGGVWGPIDMPPNPQVSADEARALVTWILSIR